MNGTNVYEGILILQNELRHRIVPVGNKTCLDL
jgi:hypothetical protein